jgi:tetratricopeptide (TPR) repeat protein
MMRRALLFAVLLVALARPVPAATDTALLKTQEGTAALLRGKFDLAVEAFDQALKTPDLPSARLVGIYSDRGVALWRLGKNEDALKDFSRSIELSNASAATFNNRANVFIELGRYDQAIADLDRAITLAPAYGAAYNNRGNANFQLGRHQAAVADYKRAIELMPTNAVPYNGRAQAQGSLGQPYAGLRFITRAISLNGKYTAAYRNRALILQHLERQDDALADYERLITLAPEDPQLYAGRGQVYLKQKKHAAAIKDFTKAIELDPQNAQSYVGRGASQIERDNPKEALADLDQAITLDPKLPEAYYRRAQVFARLADPDRAKADLTKALDLAPTYAEAFKLRAEMAEARGETDPAIADYRKAVEFDPFIPGVPEKLKKLTGLDEKIFKPLGEATKGWEIITPSNGRFVAINPLYPQLKVLLEMHGDGQPDILDWTPLADALRGFGLLRYAAGKLPEGVAGDRSEFVAILDLRKNIVVSIEPHVAGDMKAKWEWSPTGVVVTDAEGVISAHELREAPKPKPELRPLRDSPWYEDNGGRGYGRQRGLFDWLFR